MIKNAYIGLIVLIAVAVIATAAFAYNTGMLREAEPQKIPENPSPTTSAWAAVPAGPGEPVSAFMALSMAEGSDVVKEWKSNNTKTGVENIMTQVGDAGLASRWTIVYGGDSGKAIVVVNDGNVTLTIEKGDRQSYTLATGGMIDSDRANAIAMDVLKIDGYSPTGLTAAELDHIDQYTSVWDLSYPIGTDYYIIRVDAVNGTIAGKARVGYQPENGPMVRAGP